MIIDSENINGVNYYSSVARGVRYTLHNNGREWELYSTRLSLKYTVGSYKFFNNLEELEAKLKSFRGISQLIN